MPEMTFKVSLEEFGKKAAEYALDEITYNDLTIRQWVEKIASGEFQPVRHGRWISYGRDSAYNSYIRCSNCNHEVVMYEDSSKEKPKYCEECGYRMDGGE